MARLEFAGARYVRNYHLAVPHHELKIDKKKSFENPRLSKAGAGSMSDHAGGLGLEDNLIIHGDNLKALKSLLPHFAGKIKCIYIDPPYNTGNEKWVYNDNVNSPRHKEWLGKVVDADCQDRHDRWLSMMMPRLKLLRELLKDDGAIFISIDDNEDHHLRMLLDEIFGEVGFIAQIIWQKSFSPRNNAPAFSASHEYILCYSKNGQAWTANRLESTEKQLARYSNPDNDSRGIWTSSDTTVSLISGQRGAQFQKTGQGANLYPVIAPSGRELNPPSGRCWLFSRDRFAELKAENRIWWGESGNNMPRIKRFLAEIEGGLVPQTIWGFDEVGHTQESSQELKEIFLDNTGVVFPTPKPVRLLKRVIEIGSEPDSIILDSFAGSGTTAHAVLALNKEDGGNRKFILVEQEDYADTITAERVRRVIQGRVGRASSPDNSPAGKGKSGEDARTARSMEPLGGSFTYVTLGEEISENGMLSGKALPSYETLAEYCFFTATGKPFDAKKLDKKNRYIGSTDEYDVYLFYEPDVAKLKSNDTALTLNWVEQQPKTPPPFQGGGRGVVGRQKTKLVFAPVRYVGQEALSEYDIEFCQLPWEIYRKLEDNHES